VLVKVLKIRHRKTAEKKPEKVQQASWTTECGKSSEHALYIRWERNAQKGIAAPNSEKGYGTEYHPLAKERECE